MTVLAPEKRCFAKSSLTGNVDGRVEIFELVAGMWQSWQLFGLLPVSLKIEFSHSV
jgi:hypothetical protein